MAYGHISEEYLSIALYGMAITAILSSYLIKFSQQIFNVYSKINPGGFGDKRKQEVDAGVGEKRTLYILGYHKGAQAMVDFLGKWSPETLDKIVAVDYNQEVLKQLQYKKVQGIFGDLGNAATLEHIGMEHAEVIMLTIPDHLLRGVTNLSLVKTCRKVNSRAKIICMAENRKHAAELKLAGADTVIRPNHFMGELLAKIITRIEVGLD